MKKIFFVVSLMMLALAGCKSDGRSNGIGSNTIAMHDTVYINGLPNGEFTNNLPCRTVYIHQEKEGKSILFVWLHGGVHDRSLHDFFSFNHLDCCEGDDNILTYLQERDIKAIALFPICHKAANKECVAWSDCFDDVKHMIDDYVDKGLVDASRIYLAGSSDGGAGTWDYVEAHEELFSAALPMSCARPRKVSIPVYFFNTSAEADCTEQVERLNNEGCHIQYRHCSEYEHGGDGAECTPALLDKFFANHK